MAREGAPDGVGERSMFAPGGAPFVLPTAPRSDGPLAENPGVFAPSVDADGPEELRGPPTHAWLRPEWRRGFRLWRRRLGPSSRDAAARTIGIAVSTELDRGIAFILVPVLMAAGAIAYFSLGHEPGFAPLAAGVAGIAACAVAARNRPALNMAFTAVLLCVLGGLLAKTENWRAGTKMLGGEVTTRLSGTVAEVERLASGRVRLTIDVTGTERPVLRYAPDRVRVTARRVLEGITAGAAVTGLVRLMPPSGPVRPGSYDFSFESYFDGIGASGFFLRGPDLAGASPRLPPLAAFRAGVERLRLDVAERISSRIGGPEGAIAAALVVGVRSGIADDVNEALRRSGIYHVISISGLHMALVAGTIMGLLRAGFALFPDLSSRRPVKKYAAALALLGAAGYLFMSGAEVAAQRSFLMLAVMLVAVLFDRAALTLRNLAIAAIIVIAVSPHEVVGPSFQMSFAATAALVGAYAAWSDWRAEHPRSPPGNQALPRRLLRMFLAGMAGLAVTAIVAGGATAIYAAWHFQQMPSLGLFTNLAAMPIVSAVVMPFAVLGALAMPFGLDGPFFDVMGLGLTATLAVAYWFAERSPTDMVGLVPAAAVAALTLALVIATVFSTWLRIAAVPVALVGALLLINRPMPDLFVSEDGRLLGLDIGGARIAVNRPRPNEFTVVNWKRAIQARDVERPEAMREHVTAIDAKAATEGESTLTPPATGGDHAGASEKGPDAGFACADGLCVARHASGAVVVHALDAQAAVDHCATASVIVIEEASAKGVCRWKEVLVVTKRDLALHGSATITFTEASTVSPPRAAVEYAISQPYRPWHEQRRFSREARGLAPYRPSAKPERKKAAAGSSGSREPDASDSQPADADAQ